MATVVIASLGDSPVVVTALFDLVRQEKNIDQLTVFYAEDSLALIGYEELILVSLQQRCKVQGIPLYTEDVSSEEASYDFLRQLYQQTIQDTRQQNPSCQIELTISGGRKGMAALATFAAQHLGIHHVVHTVIQAPITDKVKEKNISDKVNEETTIEELKKLTRTNDIKKLDGRLFLHEYKEDRDAFVLFNIPVIPAQKG